MSDNTAVSLQKRSQESSALNIVLWTAQVILGGLFLTLGILKSVWPVEQLAALMPWTADVLLNLVRFVGITETLGAVGLLAPSILRINPMITPLGATGIAVIMILSVPFHIYRGDGSQLGMNVLFLLMAVFIAWGRLIKVPIQPRS